jgi:hypothetical protein
MLTGEPTPEQLDRAAINKAKALEILARKKGKRSNEALADEHLPSNRHRVQGSVTDGGIPPYIYIYVYIYIYI